MRDAGGMLEAGGRRPWARAGHRATLLVGAVLLVGTVGMGCAHTDTKPPSDSATLHKQLARELMQRGDWNGAYGSVQRLYRQRPTDPEVLALRGVVFRELRMLSESQVELEEAVRRAPGSAYAHGQLALLLDRRGRGERAEVHHRKAVELEPNTAAWLNNLGFSLFSRGKLPEAIAAYEKALRLEPTDARLRNNLGFAYARQGDLAKAAEHFSRVGSRADEKNNLGYACELAGKLEQAFVYYLEAVRLDAQSKRARENLVWVASRLGRALPADVVEEGRAAPSEKEQRP